MPYLDECPAELKVAILEFFSEEDAENAARISLLESGWDAFALRDSTDADHPCGANIGQRDGIPVAAERSVGYFQINSCNYPSWEWQRLYNARHNAGTAHLIWSTQGWRAWYFSAKELGLL